MHNPSSLSNQQQLFLNQILSLTTRQFLPSIKPINFTISCSYSLVGSYFYLFQRGLLQQLLYSIKQTVGTMKPKKKSSTSNKKTSKKPLANKPLLLIDKTIATTKEKTHNTIQDPVQIKDYKVGPRSARNHPSRQSCIEKLEECNLSPFSSPGGSSFSPRLRKTLSPCVKEDKEKKKVKGKGHFGQEKGPEKKRVELQKKEGKMKTKMTKQQCNFAYQNLFIQKLDEKKITEMSQESCQSIPKLSKLNLNIHLPKENKDQTVNKNKESRIKELKKKIEEKYRKELPSLKLFQMKFFCSIVLIQRLWRQRRIKKFINQFISPRSNPDCSITGSLSREQNGCRLDLTCTTEEHTSELIKKYHNLSFEKKRDMIQPEVRSTQINTTHKKLNLKELQLSAELSPQNEKKMIQFVECLRDIKFQKISKTKNHSKINVFNLQQSLSEKCLMQSFYERVFKASPSKMNNFEVFRYKQEEKHLQRSIQLINSIHSPEKAKEVIILEERFETELQSKDAIEVRPPQVETAEMSVETDDLPVSQEIKSIKQLQNLSESVICLLINEFCEEFHGFTARSILKKKKKSSLPGLKSTQKTIREYLEGLTTYMMDHYQQEVVRRYSLINPLSFLKIHHEYDEDDDYYEEQDQQMNLPIVPNTLFYEYQQIYQQQKFVVPESQKKFSNFLQGLIKIHNLLLANCLSQLLEKSRIDRIILPWDDKMGLSIRKKKDFCRKSMQKVLQSIIDNVCGSAFMRVGQFHRRLQDTIQEEKLLRSISLQYKSEGNDWSAQYQYLQLRMDLTKYVQEIILEEALNELAVFI